jgi:hypothetical protein
MLKGFRFRKNAFRKRSFRRRHRSFRKDVGCSFSEERMSTLHAAASAKSL